MSGSGPGAATLPGLLRLQAGGSGAAVFVRDGMVTFSALHERAGQYAAAVAAAGIRPGERVGLLMANSAEWLAILFGATAAGAVVVPLSTWSTAAELAFLLDDAKVRLLLTSPAFNDADFVSMLAALLAEGRLPADLRMVLVSDDAPDGFQTVDGFLGGVKDILAVPDVASPSDDAVVLYTSGSTSRPKGVRLVHRGIVENGFNIGERQGLRQGDRVFLSAPLFWSYGGANALPAAFSHGAALVLAEKFDAAGALSMIEDLACTAIYTLPAMTNAMVRHPGFDRHRTRTLRTGLTIGSPQDFHTAVETLGVPELCNIYGATETYGNCAVTSHRWPLERRAHCQGEPLPGQEFRFRDMVSGALVEAGQPGLVEVRGHVSPGYSGASAELNGDVFTPDGFYRTGDVGRLDETGAFVFIGRDSEMIKRAGINVSPAEVEDVLVGHEGVSAAAVVGVADAERGERIVAYVVPAGPSSISTEALQAHCRTLLSKYKLPDRIEMVPALPLTATGKLQRKELRKAAADLLASTPEVLGS